MKKGIVSVVLALTFAVSTVAVAATVKCTVDSVEGDKVTMTCKKASSLKAGDAVKVKAKSGAAAIEGC
jgi:class 3 adenylate cyclase